MSIKEDKKLCSLENEVGGNITFKAGSSNTISQSAGILFFTCHSDCSKFFSPGHQIVLLSADDLASYFTKKSFHVSFYLPQIVFPIHSCFRRGFFSFLPYFQCIFHPEMFPQSCQNLKFKFSSVVRC